MERSWGMSENEEMFYIISIKWTVGEQLCFWRPNAQGYTNSLDEAGKYPKSKVYANERYYNNGYGSLAVPCETIHEKFRKRHIVIWNSDEMAILQKPFKQEVKEQEIPLQLFTKGGDNE